MNDDDVADGILQYMLDETLIKTRVNRESKGQEFAITERGWDVMMMLKFFNGEESK
jgi:predicted transcriptional regulator